MRHARSIDHPLPSGVDIACEHAIPQCADDRLEGGLRHGGDLMGFLGRAADVNQSPERRVIARHAPGELQEKRVATGELGIAPARVLLAQPRGRPDERTKTRKGATGLDHGSLALGGDVALARAGANGFDGSRGASIRDPRGLAQIGLLRRALHLPQIVDQA